MDKNITFFIFFTLIILFYALINFWIGIRGRQSLGLRFSFFRGKLYWLLFWLVVLSYPMARIVSGRLPHWISSGLYLLGSYWLAAMFYFVLFIALVDFLRLLLRLLGWVLKEPGVRVSGSLSYGIGLTVVLIVTSLVLYGSWNARQPVVRHFEINIAKQAGEIKEMRVAAVSDLHLGLIVDKDRLQKMVELVEGLEPDLVLLPGDIIEDSPGYFVEQGMDSIIRQMEPRYGIYAVPGNHEYIGGQWDEIFRTLQNSGVHVLRDSYVKVADSFYLAGMDDRSRQRYEGMGRLELGDTVSGIDKSLPVILMDHQPTDLEDAVQAGIDLQISGHTHRGQMFPNNFITSRIFEVDWGYLAKDGLQVLVTSGYGTWGPPIRVGNRPEILDIVIHFGKDN